MTMPEPHPQLLTITAEPLTSAAWAPFGQVIGRDECRLELRDDGVFHLDVLTYEWKPLRCDHLNRHHKATQALIPLGGAPAVVVVAPGEVDFSSVDHLRTILALRTWHWGPYPVGPVVHLANVQNRDVVHDNEVAHLERDLATIVHVQV
jgi:ureidoglycolate hydrolase